MRSASTSTCSAAVSHRDRALPDGRDHAHLIQRRGAQRPGEPAHAFQSPHKLAANLLEPLVAQLGIGGVPRHPQPDQQCRQSLTGVVVQLQGDPLPLGLRGLQRPVRHIPEALTVGGQPIRHPVEGARQPLEFAVRHGRARHPGVGATTLHPLGRLLQPPQRGERETEDEEVHDRADRDGHRGEEADQPQRRRRGVVRQEPRHERRSGRDRDHDERRVRDEDLVKEREPEEGPGDPRAERGALHSPGVDRPGARTGPSPHIFNRKPAPGVRKGRRPRVRPAVPPTGRADCAGGAGHGTRVGETRHRTSHLASPQRPGASCSGARDACRLGGPARSTPYAARSTATSYRRARTVPIPA